MGDPSIADLRERLARIEEVQRNMQERQTYIMGILEKQASELGEWVERISLRVNALEHIWAKILGAASIIGIIFSFLFDWIKNRITS
jgi:hypothetical protein